jgi:hypothetical protein
MQDRQTKVNGTACGFEGFASVAEWTLLLGARLALINYYGQALLALSAVRFK